MYEDLISNYLSGSNPLAMPAAGAPAASSFFGPYNPYDPNNSASQRMDMLAQTQRFNGTPMYQQIQGYMPDMSPEVKALWDKKQAYNALSEADKQLARTTGNGYFTNEDQFNLERNTIGNKAMDFNMQAKYNQWTDRFNDQIATNILNQDNGNLPSFSKQWADATLNNKTWASSTINDRTNVALPEGNQMGRILMSQANHGLVPDQQLMDHANAHDWWYDQLHPNLQALQTNSGTRAGAGMADQGSGNLQSFSMVDPSLGKGEWGGNRGQYSGLGWGNGNNVSPRSPNFGWGTQEAYDAGYHPPAPFRNNSLLNTGGNGISSTGTTAVATLPNLDGPGRGTWSGSPSPPGFGPSFGDEFRMVGSGGGSSGAGGPLRFADPSATGNDSTLQDMPGYHPEQGNSAGNGWRGTLRQGSVYGGTPEEGYKSPNLNRDWLNSQGTGVDYGALGASSNPFLVASAGSNIMNTGSDAFSNYTDPSWQRSGYAQYPARTSNPNYRPAGMMPWYTQINPFTAGQIMATMGMRS